MWARLCQHRQKSTLFFNFFFFFDVFFVSLDICFFFFFSILSLPFFFLYLYLKPWRPCVSRRGPLVPSSAARVDARERGRMLLLVPRFRRPFFATDIRNINIVVVVESSSPRRVRRRHRRRRCRRRRAPSPRRLLLPLRVPLRLPRPP